MGIWRYWRKWRIWDSSSGVKERDEGVEMEKIKKTRRRREGMADWSDLLASYRGSSLSVTLLNRSEDEERFLSFFSHYQEATCEGPFVYKV